MSGSGPGDGARVMREADSATLESVGEMVAQLSASHAERVALVGPDGPVSWGQLAEQARCIASSVLRNAPDDLSPVAVLAPFGAGRIAAQLGVLCAGRTLVPLDSSANPGHLKDLLSNAGARVVLCSHAGLEATEQLVGSATICLAIEDALSAGVVGESQGHAQPDHTACIFYTSGSTGAPKGVCHSHRSLLANARSRVLGYHLEPGDRLAAVYAPSSGGALATILSAWLAGGSVFLLDEREGVHRLGERLHASGVTVLALIVSSFRELARTCGTADPATGCCIAGVRLLSLSGETLHASDLADVSRVFGDPCVAVNSYATTETGTVCRAVGATTAPDGEVTLGQPVDGVEVLLLDDKGAPVAGAGRGQIAVRGAALATGYWRRPELEARVFVGAGPQRMYLTGDVGRRDDAGVLWHLGRRDGAVSIDGRLVDVGSVERALAAVPGVSEAAVVAVSGDRAAHRLEAHVVLEADGIAEPAELRAQLAASGPSTALPASIHVHDSLPRLPGGKLDRRLLAARRVRATRGAGPEGTPRSEVDLRLAALFAQALGVASVGRSEDFFALGGHSLLAVGLLKSIEECFLCTLSLPDLVATPDVARLAERLESGEAPLRLSQCVQLAEGGDGTPVFCVCGILLYRDLAEQLGGEYPVYAVYVQAEIDLLREGADGRQARRSLSVEELAAAYIREMRAVRPHGPYHVLGESFGGLVAFEIAHQLRNAGEDVGLVGLLDTMPPGCDDGFVAELRASGRRLRRFLRERLRGVMDPVDPDQDRLHGLSPAVRRMEAGLSRLRQRLYRSARRRYRLAAYSGRLAFFRARDAAGNTPGSGDPSRIWRDVAYGEFDNHVVPGTHIGILEPPHVASLAGALRECLRQAGTGAGPRV